MAVMDRNHGSITKDIAKQREEWRQTVLQALSVDEVGFEVHRAQCAELSEATFEEGRGAHRVQRRKQFHEYLHIVFRVHDQYGDPIPDYFIEFYQDEDDDQDNVMEKIHSEILESVKVNSLDASYRSFLFDLTDMRAALEENPSLKVDMSIVAADLSEDVGYRNPPDVGTAGIRVFDAERQDFFLPNQPLLIDVTLYRDASPNVFKIKGV